LLQLLALESPELYSVERTVSECQESKRGVAHFFSRSACPKQKINFFGREKKSIFFGQEKKSIFLAEQKSIFYPSRALSAAANSVPSSPLHKRS